MKDFNKLERHLNDLASGQEQDPPENLWDNIEEALPRKKKKKALLFLLFGLILGYGLIFLVYPGKNTFADQSSILEAASTKEDNAPFSSEVIVTTKDLQSEASQMKKDETEFSKSIPSSLKIGNDLSEDWLDKNPNEEKFNQPLAIETSSSSSSSSSNELIDIEDVAYPNSSSTKIIEASPDTPTQLNPEFSYAPSINVEEQIERNKLDDFYPVVISEIPFLGIGKMDDSREYFVLTEDKKSEVKLFPKPQDESLDSDLRSKYFIDFNVLAGTHATGLEENDTTGYYRSSTESNWYTWGVSTQVGLRLKNGVYFKTGVEYIDSRDRFSFERSNVKLEDLVDTMPNQFSIVGYTYFNVGDISYKQFNVPLSIGAELDKGKFKLGMELSSVFNLKFSAEGKIRTGDLSFSRVENEKGVYRSSLGLGLRAAFTFGMDVHDRGTIYLKPTWSKYFNPTNHVDNPVNSKLNQYYLEMSYRYKF